MNKSLELLLIIQNIQSAPNFLPWFKSQARLGKTNLIEM